MYSEAEDKLDEIKINIIYASKMLPKSFTEKKSITKYLIGNDNKKLISSISNINNYFELVNHVIKIEKQIYPYINELLRNIDYRKSFNEQPKIADEILKYCTFLKNTSFALSQDCSYFLEQDVSTNYQNIKSIERNIALIKSGISNSDKIGKSLEDLEKSSNNEDVFLSHIKNFMLLSFVKCQAVPAGRKIIAHLAGLAESFRTEQNEKLINIKINYSHKYVSLKATAVEESAFCSLRGNQLDRNTLVPMEKLALLPISKGNPSISTFSAPVIFESSELDEDVRAVECYENYGIHFKNDATVYNNLSHSIIGSLSFDKDAIPFFTPAHIEIMHESLHIIGIRTAKYT